jgi:hypothetical protein
MCYNGVNANVHCASFYLLALQCSLLSSTFLLWSSHKSTKPVLFLYLILAADIYGMQMVEDKKYLPL